MQLPSYKESPILKFLALRSASIDYTRPNTAKLEPYFDLGPQFPSLSHVLLEDNVYLNELFEFFRRAQHLVICEARVYEGQSEGFYIPQEPVVMPFLTTLKCVLKMLTAPTFFYMSRNCATSLVDPTASSRTSLFVNRLIHLLEKTPMLESLRLISSEEEGLYLTEEFIDLFSATSVFDEDSTDQFSSPPSPSEPRRSYLLAVGPTIRPYSSQ
ncbi:hypothetical protein CPB83DRAFT_893281 [Crepidotus variabilis]|uniref:Uncharacterized protein n=1 Tax=Crepidotus variabilis TaxID=179855 RepID=A0A9P6EIV9_9AGAR|nr:hypothetical protein CPB83DRAFT_893281 [Crepidotus variabilis]